MRIISHPYAPQPPPPLPPPLSVDNLLNDTDSMSQRRLDDDQAHHHRAAQSAHDPARSPYANSAVPHHERPPTDPTNPARALPPPAWRGIISPLDHRNGDHISQHRDPQPSSNKRKLDEASEESQNKVRKTVRDHLVLDYTRIMTMTTVICLHAAVAQKSYGSEKRFLCPPPVVRIETPYLELKNQNLCMSIVTETGERGPEQRSALDNNMVASFKYLHVAGTAKSKSFQLALDIAQPALTSTENPDGLPGRVWASFDSAPVTIISKPSKKTAKTRNISSCILAGGPVSLFNRINSQTVRTKYMTIEHAQLCASNLSWSAFNVTVTRRHAETGPPITGPQPVTYGSEIQLVDSLTGITTSPLVIRKVDKGKVSPEDGGPVSQMQKIALQRINPDGSRSYLSAASPPGPSVPGIPTPGGVGQPASHPLVFGAPRVRDEVREGVRVVTDEVDDYLCWTIVGISKFQYTFFDGFGQNTPVPHVAITPFPTLFTAPAYRPAPHTLELTVSNFFYQQPDTLQHQPLEVWVGSLGPLRQRIFQATPPGPLTSVSPYGIPPSNGPVVGEAANVAEPGPSGPNAHNADTPQTIVAPPRFVPSGPLHTIIIVDLPPVGEIVKALQDMTPALHGGGTGHDPVRASRSGDRGISGRDGHQRENNGASAEGGASGAGGGGPSSGGHEDVQIPPPPPPVSHSHSENGGGPLTGSMLPILFVRGSDGIGYHSGRSITCEHIYPEPVGLGASPDGRNPVTDAPWLGAGTGTWTLRVI